jgi:hypothetical protein
MNHDQFTLPFLDTTIVAEGFGLYGGFPTAKSPAPVQMNLEPEEAEVLDASIPYNHPFRRRITDSPATESSPPAGKPAPKTIWPRSDS